MIWDNIKGYIGGSTEPFGGITVDKSDSLKELNFIKYITKTNANELINFDEVNSFIEKYKTELNNTKSVSEKFFKNIDVSLKNYIQNNDAATLSVEDFYASQLKQTTGFMGVKEAIATYNHASENGIETQT